MERTTRGRPKGSRGGRGKGKRGRKPRVVISDTEENETNAAELEEEKTAEPEIDNTTETPAPEAVKKGPMETKETDMSQLEPLETPHAFTTMTRNVPQVMLRLNWDHKVNLIGEKVLNPMIYCCDQCNLPILIYGRMIQCKHVFCLTCARTEAVLKICPRCKEKVVRVEQTGLGTVFMCTHGGTRYGKAGCRRTYLSQRDLQAHINHRHVMTPNPQDIKTTEKSSSAAILQNPPHQQNSHLRKDSMVQPPPPAMPHPVKQPFNSSVFQSTPQSAANKMSHHSQEVHGFYNNQHGGGHQFGNNGTGASGSSSGNNFYQPFNNNMGHYSQQGASQPQQHQNWNQQQQYFR